MLFRESGKEGNESIRFVRTYYCSEAKGARQKTLGKIKKSDISSSVFTSTLLEELSENDATEAEIAEVKEWLVVMQNKALEDRLHSEKDSLLFWLKMAKNTQDKAIELLTEQDQAELFDSIKTLEDRLREKGIRRPRKPRK